jgi:hypothetical protein
MADERAGCCETCRHWLPNGPLDGEEDNPRGECRRGPPVTLTCLLPEPSQWSAYDYQGVWPETESDDWCGEYCPRLDPPPAERG